MAAKIFRINYKSDFILTMNSDAGWAIPFCIKFWTSVPSRAYFVSFDGTTYTHCAYDPSEPTKLVVQFDDHHLPIGDLNYQIAYHFTVADFPNDTEDEVINPAAITTEIDGETYHVMLDFTGETATEIEFNLPAYANEAERIQNELQRQQNEAERIAAELQREQATAAAVEGAENVNAQLAGNILTVTNRNGVSTSVNTKGEQGERGPVGPEGPQGEQGVSIVDFSPKSQTTTTLIYTVTFSDGHTQDVAIPKGAKGDTGATGPQGPQGDTGVSITGMVETGETTTATLYNITFSNGTTQQVAIPKGEKGDTGEQGPVGPQGPQGPMGDVAVITPEQQAAFTMYSETGQNTNGPMTQKAVTDALVASAISYDNSQSGLAADNVQVALDEVGDELYTESNYPFELGTIDGENGQEITKTNGTRIRTKGNVPKSTTKINFKITRSCTQANIILYNNEVFAGSVQRAIMNITAGTYVYDVNVEYAWDSYRIVCFTSGYTSQNLDGNYSVGYSSIKDKLDENVANINNVLPHGEASSVSLELSESDYAYGNINGIWGTIEPNDKVIYLVDALDVKNASSLSYSLDNNYRLGIAVYDKNGFIKKDEWFTGSGTYQLGGAMFIRFVIAYPAGGSTFDYASANPQFSLYLNGLKQVASLDDVDNLYDAIYKGINYRFELGSIEGQTGEPVKNTTGTRIRSKEYIPKGDGIMRLTMVMDATTVNIICYKEGNYAGWVSNAFSHINAGNYTFKITVPFDYDAYKVVGFVTGATTVSANNTFVALPPAAYYVDDNSINIEALTTEKIYEYYDALAEKFPNYISKRVLGMDTSGQHEIREYVATLRDSYAYLYKERCYAWKNGSTTIFTESVSPRVGDATYSDQLTTSTGYTVSASNCNNLTITVNGTTYSRQESEDIAADIQYRSTKTSSSITVSGKTYNRLPVYDKSSICKKTIVSICNEHGPGINGDPREPSVVMFYLLQALCGETNENPQLDWLKHYAKIVIIPVSNPYAYDEEGDSTTLGNMMGRVNPNGVNINRNYPTTNWVTLANNEAGAYGGSEIETQYNINCIMRHNADIAIDEHCLGPNTNNYNQWHYEGLLSSNISSEKQMMMLATYNLAYSSYGASLAGHGSTWIEQHNIAGCLLEMNQGYSETLHSDIILRADRQIWMGVLEYYGIFLL